MKIFYLVLLGVTTVAIATLHDGENFCDNWTLKDKQWFVLKLLNQVLDPVMYKDIEDVGKNYKIENNLDKYMKADVVKRFIINTKTARLPPGEIFCLYCEQQMGEVIDMFHVLHYAKDFTTFIRTASWMRLYLNEGMFIYAFIVAIRHRDDCKGIFLPAPYEVYPNYFVRADVIKKANLVKMKKGLSDRKITQSYGIKKTEDDVFVIDENVYDLRVCLNTDDRLRYFTEDIDLNAYYYYFYVDFPFWMNDSIYDITRVRRGELSYYVHQQLLARYYLERLSNNMCDIEALSYYKPLKTGYWPWLTFPNGIEMPLRYNNHVIDKDSKIETVRLVEDYEQLIRESILKGYFRLPDGVRLELKKPEDIETLGRLVYGKIDKYHGDFYRYLIVLISSLLGLDTMSSARYAVVPTVLHQYQTAVRDPVFWQLQKRLFDFFVLFKNRLPSYTREDLYFPGVRVDNVVVDKLVTYFDDYYMDMTNAVPMSDDELKKSASDLSFFVRKRRLNHQPFKITMDIVSDKDVDSVFRIFLGPKEDCMGRILGINENRLNFVELDAFIYKLTIGGNTITRLSTEMNNIVRDRIMTRDLVSKLETVTDYNALLRDDVKNVNTGFPVRLLLPKGRRGGLQMMVYIVVTPITMFDIHDRVITNIDDSIDYRSTVMMDKMSLGFPLDRHIDVPRFFTPNMKFLDVMIFHRTTECDMKTRWEKHVLKGYNIDRATDVED